MTNTLIGRYLSVAILMGLAMSASHSQDATRQAPQIAGMDFNFSITGDARTNGPTAVYSDGLGTYFQLRREVTPAIYRNSLDDPALPTSRDGLLLRADDTGPTFLLVWPDAQVRIAKLGAPVTSTVSIPSKTSPDTQPTVIVAVPKSPTAITPREPLSATDQGVDQLGQLEGQQHPLNKSQAVTEPDTAVSSLVSVEISPKPLLQSTTEIKWVRFSVATDQSLSSALKTVLKESAWSDLVWDVADDFVVQHGYTVVGIDIPDLFGKILKPYGLDARFHRGNHLVHIFVRGTQR